MSQPTDTRRPIASRSWPIMGRAAAGLAKAGVTPNAVSVLSVVYAIMAGVVLAASSQATGWTVSAVLGLAAACIQLRLICNLLDGMIAIEGGRGSPIGSLYNEVPDRISDSVILIGAGLAAGSSLAMGLVAALMAMATAYVRQTGKACGAGSDFGGPMAKQQRMAVVTVTCMVLAVWPGGADWRIEGVWGRVLTVGSAPSAGIWSIALAVIALGSAITALLRLRRIARAIRGNALGGGGGP